jgi:DNA polymerase-1
MPLLIRNKQLIEIKKWKLQNVVNLENRFIPCISTMRLKGVKLDKYAWLEAFQKYTALEQAKLAELKEVAEINWNSSQQVARVFKELGVPVEIIDKKKSTEEDTIFKDTVSRYHLSKYGKKYPIVKPYLEYKGYQRLTSTYGEKFLKYLNLVSNKVHPNFIQMVTTGRMASSGFNAQNIPAGKGKEGFREAFVPESGNSFVVCDYSSQETRILADLCKDPNMVSFFNGADTDFHSYTARKVWKVEVQQEIKNPDTHEIIQIGINEDLRRSAKTVSFLIPYGGGATKLSEGMQIPLKEAEEIISGYFSVYPELNKYFKKMHNLVEQLGYIRVDNYSKRLIYIKYYEEYSRLKEFIEYTKKRYGTKDIPKGVWKRFFTIKGEMERQVQNYRIQGLGANQTKLAACMFYEHCLKNKIDA